jgi:drug/metabolite transporter (DMT)-like permease
MTQAVLAMLFTQVVWGIGPVFVRTLGLDLGPANSLIIRYVMVSLAYLPFLMMHGRWRIAREDWPRLLFLGWVGILGYNLGSVFGFNHATAGLGGLVIGTQPILIALMAAFVNREALTHSTIAGLLVAFSGTVLLFWPDLQAGNTSMVKGALMIFCAGIAWSAYVIAARPLIHRYGAMAITAWSIVLATLPMLLLASEETPQAFLNMTARNWLEMAYLGGLSTFVASITWNYAAGRLPSAVAGAFLYLVPVVAVIAGAVLLDEIITVNIVTGGLMILTGVAIAQIGPALFGRKETA